MRGERGGERLREKNLCCSSAGRFNRAASGSPLQEGTHNGADISPFVQSALVATLETFVEGNLLLGDNSAVMFEIWFPTPGVSFSLNMGASATLFIFYLKFCSFWMIKSEFSRENKDS